MLGGMRTRRAKLISMCVVTAGVLAIVWVVTSESPPISMKVLGFTAKRWSDDIAPRMGSREYVLATIELTNATSRPITYWARYDPTFAEYTVLHETTMGWKKRARGRFCGTGMQQTTLAPLKAITFEAVVERDRRCKVALNYSDGRAPSRVWQRLPGWLTQRLPWTPGWSTVTTEAIDLRSAVGLTVKQQEPWLKPPQETPAVQAAAQSGDADAQFGLAGRYFRGDGVEKSLVEGLRWFEAAATNGNTEAAYNLGTIYEYGLGPVADRARAIEWYRRASERGHTQAQDKLRTLAASER